MQGRPLPQRLDEAAPFAVQGSRVFHGGQTWESILAWRLVPICPNDSVIHHAEVVPRRESNPRYTSVGISNPAILRPPNVLAQSEGPLVPIGGVGQELIHVVERAIDVHSDGAGFDRFRLGRRVALDFCGNRRHSEKCAAQGSGRSRANDHPLQFQHACDATGPRRGLYRTNRPNYACS
jgi:hypothetical protein